MTALLYILTGLTLYAGGHHAFLAVQAAARTRHLPLAGMYCLLAGFCLASALAFQPASQLGPLSAGTWSVSLGILLWLSIIWYVAYQTNARPMLLLDLFTAVWLIFLIRNFGESGSLLYSQQAGTGHWWTALQLTMLASLAYAAWATYKYYRQGEKRNAMFLAAGLGLLAGVTAYDFFVYQGWVGTGYLTSLGFLGFLAVSSLAPVAHGWREHRKPKPPPMIYSLSFKPDQASFHSDVSQLRTPLTPVHPAGQVPDDQQPARENRIPVDEHEHIEDIEPEVDTPLETKTRPPEPPIIDQSALNTITDDLIDIAVYATMALNRFKRGDADPVTLESLCKKIRTRSIKTRRLANQLSRPDKVGYDKGSPTDD